mmetsp:Transcript_20702/g.45201  ORF Transcript_20702/g.45201 Transcript_20702/m.45201 type:complete len:328 (-) Transcript_20702:173-1156(-)
MPPLGRGASALRSFAVSGASVRRISVKGTKSQCPSYTPFFHSEVIGRTSSSSASCTAAPVLVSPIRYSSYEPMSGVANNRNCQPHAVSMSQLQQLMNQQQQRCFSSRRGGGGYKKGGKGGGGSDRSSGPMKNEHLVRAIIGAANAPGPESVQVRLVVDKGPGNPPDTDVVSLQSAIETSNDLGVDLIEISLKQDVPVIKAIDFTRLMYEKSKKSKPSGGGNKGSGKGGSSKATKEFKFKAGIADNDLERKADNMIKYLLKGHPCQVTILSNRFRLRQDANAASNTLQRVREVLGDHVMEPKNTKVNEAGTYTTMRFEPNPKKAKETA